jgi:hypothetical protein
MNGVRSTVPHVTGLLPLAIAALGSGLIAWLVARARREIAPTRAAFDRLGRDLRPALLELRTETERTRAELARRQRLQ